MTLLQLVVPPQLPSLGRPVLGLDVGASSIKHAWMSADGRIEDTGLTPLATSGEDELTDLVERLVRNVVESGHPVQAIGVNVPGVIDEVNGIVVSSENLRIWDFGLRGALAERLGLPVALRHDVRGAARAERTLGSGVGAQSMLFLSIGTGIAGALFLAGEAYTADGYAGEVGHSRVVPLGDERALPCACGNAGCLETISSARAIARRYEVLTGHQTTGSDQVFERAAAGETAAGRVISEAIDALVLALQQLVSALAPEVIVIGGGLSLAGDAFFGPLRDRLDSVLTFHRRPSVMPATFGMQTGALGAALAAIDVSVGTHP